MSQFHPPEEIQQRLRKRFLDRLGERLKKIRKELIAREWQSLRHECRQLKTSGATFGFPDLGRLAERAESSIPDGETSRARIIPEAKHAIEALVTGMETLLQGR
jgi:HPt (histidine-containing phosphotransfer) domain-containing protein